MSGEAGEAGEAEEAVCRRGGAGRGVQYLVVPGLVATPVQQPFFYSDGAGLQRGIGELEVGLRRRARALRARGRATSGTQVSASATADPGVAVWPTTRPATVYISSPHSYLRAFSILLEFI